VPQNYTSIAATRATQPPHHKIDATKTNMTGPGAAATTTATAKKI
jgi:hypothetical protein